MHRRAFGPLFLLISYALVSFALAGCECDGPEDLDGGLPDGALPDGSSPDGAVPDGGPRGPRVTVCPGDALEPLPDGICDATAGDDNLLITADVLTPGEVLRGGQVLVGADGRIACVGCDCSGEAGAAGATTIVCPDGVVSPGLINGHEHLDFVAGPASMTEERYEHRQEWREGLGEHSEIGSGGFSSADAVRWDELRMAMAGVTSGNLNGGQSGFVRSLDEGSTEGLGPPRVHYETFILGEIDGDPPMAVDCSYDELPLASDIEDDAAFTPHLAEGIADTARNEFLCVREGANDVIQPNTAIIHGVGLLAIDVAEIASDGSALIWSPRTNISLYGDTARVTLYDNQGVLIALGTDWLRSGSMNMLRELQCADEFNRNHLGGYFTDEQLWLMATSNAARVLAYSDLLGTLSPGLVADIAIYDGSERSDHRAVIGARPQDVALVLRGGQPLFGERAVVDALESGCDPLDVCGASRAACVTREIGQSYSDLAAANSSEYPLFFCDASPTDEPTCVPSRNAMAPLPSPEVDGSNRYTGEPTASDMDGDGIENATDNCASIFNPIRPVDMGTQADFDGDGVGDECDPCPIDADTTECTAVDPDDRDRDGVTDTMDNCQGLPNEDQADTDDDGIGDACDPCPEDPNPAGAACPGTLYEINDGAFAIGGRVRVSRSVVTAVTDPACGDSFSCGFTMQVPTDHPAYAGPDGSGMFVYTGGPAMLGSGDPVVRGATIDVDGTVGDYFGQRQLESVTVTASAETSAIPDPVVVSPSEVDTGGTRAEALDGVLVTVESVVVTDAAPMPSRTGADAMGEFEVDASLRVDDLFFLIDPFVRDGENFDSITGVLMFRDQRHKLHPRDADDYRVGSPQIAELSPALSYTRVGDVSAETFPEPLTVTLTRAAAADTAVTIESSNPAGLMVQDVTVPAGASSVTVPVTGSVAEAYTVTARLGDSSDTAAVRVLGVTDVPTEITLSPTSTTVRVDEIQTFTVTLDVPAPRSTGTVIDLMEDTGGMIPGSVTVPGDALSATFDYQAPASIEPEIEVMGTLTATLNSTTPPFERAASLTVLPPLPGTVILNEIDYDQPSTDGAEYIELYNPGATPADLTNLQLVLVNGGSTPPSDYQIIDLRTAYPAEEPSPELPAGAYLVVRASETMTSVPEGTLTISFSSSTNQVQNGAPDGVAVYDTSTMTLVDALSYEGSITAAQFGGMTFDLVEGAATPAEDSNSATGSISRLPDGDDTNDAANDWSFTPCLTPGEPNLASCP